MFMLKSVADERIKAAVADERAKAADERAKAADERIKAAVADERAKAAEKNVLVQIDAAKKIARAEERERASIVRLENELKKKNVEILMAKHVVSVRSAIESLMYEKYPGTRGMQKRIDIEYSKKDKFYNEYKAWCKKFACTPDDKVVQNIYHSLSTHIDASGGIPFHCYTENNVFSTAEWACIIGLLRIHLPDDAVCVYDKNGTLIESMDP